MTKIKRFKENFALNILVLALLWGSDYVLIKVAIQSFHPILFVSLKLLIGAISIFFILKFILEKRIVFVKSAVIFVLLAAFLTLSFLRFLFLSEKELFQVILLL